MKPDLPLALQKLAATLMFQVGPQVQNDYAQRTTWMTAIMLQCMSEEWDRAAERRVEENGALRELFAHARSVVEDEALREQLAAASTSSDESFLISALDQTGSRLRSLLIDLHKHVETLSSAAAAELEAMIWSELARSTRRRALSLAPF